MQYVSLIPLVGIPEIDDLTAVSQFSIPMGDKLSCPQNRKQHRLLDELQNRLDIVNAKIDSSDVE